MKVSTFMPKYMKDFKCIGPKCSDTCCAGWDINIDKYTYDKYINSDGKMKDLIKEKFIKNNNDNKDDFNYGFMILKDKKRCPFLNSNMLCDIHKDLGEEKLCITCKRYPRVFNIIDGIYEKSGLPSCEEICSKALLNKEKMEFIEAEEDLDEDTIEIRRIIDSESFNGSDSMLQYFWDIRVISINIMQLRQFSISERFNIIHEFYKKIENTFNLGDYDSLESILDTFNNEDINYEDIKGETLTISNKFFNKLMCDELIEQIKSFKLKKCVIEYKEGINKAKNIEEYLKENVEILQKVSTYDYIFENYIINQIFKDLIPFNNAYSIVESINTLKNVYKVIKAYVLGIALNSNKEITDLDIVRVIQALSKDIEHNKVFEHLLK